MNTLVNMGNSISGYALVFPVDWEHISEDHLLEQVANRPDDCYLLPNSLERKGKTVVFSRKDDHSVERTTKRVKKQPPYDQTNALKKAEEARKLIIAKACLKAKTRLRVNQKGLYLPVPDMRMGMSLKDLTAMLEEANQVVADPDFQRMYHQVFNKKVRPNPIIDIAPW